MLSDNSWLQTLPIMCLLMLNKRVNLEDMPNVVEISTSARAVFIDIMSQTFNSPKQGIRRLRVEIVGNSIHTDVNEFIHRGEITMYLIDESRGVDNMKLELSRNVVCTHDHWGRPSDGWLGVFEILFNDLMEALEWPTEELYETYTYDKKEKDNGEKEQN